jgi:hypothetical protein
MAGVCGRQKRRDSFLNILTGKVFPCPVFPFIRKSGLIPRTCSAEAHIAFVPKEIAENN